MAIDGDYDRSQSHLSGVWAVATISVGWMVKPGVMVFILIPVPEISLARARVSALVPRAAGPPVDGCGWAGIRFAHSSL